MPDEVSRRPPFAAPVGNGLDRSVPNGLYCLHLCRFRPPFHYTRRGRRPRRPVSIASHRLPLCRSPRPVSSSNGADFGGCRRISGGGLMLALFKGTNPDQRSGFDFICRSHTFFAERKCAKNCFRGRREPRFPPPPRNNPHHPPDCDGASVAARDALSWKWVMCLALNRGWCERFVQRLRRAGAVDAKHLLLPPFLFHRNGLDRPASSPPAAPLAPKRKKRRINLRFLLISPRRKPLPSLPFSLSSPFSPRRLPPCRS